MKLKTFAFISVLSMGTFVLANIYSWSLPEAMSEEAVLGKQVWQKNNCISCHTIFGNGGYEGDDLTYVTERRTLEELKNFLVNSPVMRPNIMRAHPGLGVEEAEQLIDYFKFLSSIPTLGWPPEPYQFKYQ